MTDKEVGEIWRWAITACGDQPVVLNLIHKLVEVRDELNREKGSCRSAIKDFGIPEELWDK